MRKCTSRWDGRPPDFHRGSVDAGNASSASLFPTLSHLMSACGLFFPELDMGILLVLSSGCSFQVEPDLADRDLQGGIIDGAK